MAFDYKKEYKEFYMPPARPVIVEVPPMRYLAVSGKGDPNSEGSEYKRSIELLYGIAYTIKMSRKTEHNMEGYFDFVVPPLEGFWWQDGTDGVDYSRKDDFNFISVIRLPEFVTEKEFEWAVAEATSKKKTDYSAVKYFKYDEGLCVQCMHIGPYDSEPETVRLMHEYAETEGYVPDLSSERLHHEIYLSDVRKADPAKLKTVIRHPVRTADGSK